jgi:hypothetical protein
MEIRVTAPSKGGGKGFREPPQFLNSNLRTVVGWSRCGQREATGAPNWPATCHSIVITTATITRGATDDVHRASADRERFIFPGRRIGVRVRPVRFKTLDYQGAL